MDTNKDELRSIIKEIVDEAIETKARKIVKEEVKKEVGKLRDEMHQGFRSFRNFMFENFYTKQETDEKFLTKQEFNEFKITFYNLQDMVLGIRNDIREMKNEMILMNNHLNEHGLQLDLVKYRQNLKLLR